jgi:hypothetical protein
VIRNWLRRRRLLLPEEVRAEAQLDLRDGLLEARADRIAELERLNARLAAELATYKTRDYMAQALRLRRRLAEQAPRPDQAGRHQAEPVTEFLPRRPR